MTQHAKIYPNSPLFWQINSIGLGLAAILLLWFFPVGGALDHQIIAPWVNADGTFPYRDNWWLTRIAHQWVKNLIIAMVVVLLMQFFASFYGQKWRAYRWTAGYTLMAMLLSVSLVGLFKSQSSHACPWSLAEQGSHGVIWLEHSLKAGKCFPGGHSSAGFGLLALFFAYRLQAPQRARFYLATALILGFAMGWAQMMRGAHFISHNLWTLWLTWLIDLSLYAVCLAWSHWRDTLSHTAQLDQTVAPSGANGSITLTDNPPR